MKVSKAVAISQSQNSTIVNMILNYLLHFALLAAPVISTPISTVSTSKHLSRRDYWDDNIKDVIERVVDSTNSLTQKVKAFSGKIEDAGPVVEGSNALLSTIQNGTITVKSADTLSLLEVVAILPSVTQLNSAVKGVSDALIAKKFVFDSASLTTVVLEQLNQQKNGAQGLVDALLSKMPKYLPESLGQTLSNPSLNSLNEAVIAYGGSRWPGSSSPPVF
jgi:hypothetical protein